MKRYNLLKLMCFLNRKKSYFVPVFGVFWPLGYVNWKYLYKEIFLKKTYNFNAQSDTPLVLDCGSNVGLSLMYFKEKYPNASLICIEANPEMFEVLKATCEKNKYKSVSLVNKALTGSGLGSLDFFIGDEASSLGSSIYKRDNLSKTVSVRALLLSELIDKEVDFLKLDIEGAEYEVLSDLIKTKKLMLIKEGVVEVHKIAGRDSSALIDSVREFMEVELIDESSDAILFRFKNVTQ